MSQNTVITFPVEYMGKGSPNEYTLQLILTAYLNAIGADRAWDAHDYKLLVSKWGSIDQSYDIENALLVPGKTSLEIEDPLETLHDMMFGTSAAANTADKRWEIIIKLNGVQKFKGNFREDAIVRDDGSKKLTAEASPKTDIINKQMIYDDDGNVINPFSYTATNYYHIVSLLEDIFQLVNSSISYSGGSLNIVHDWKFQGKRDGDANYLNDIEFSELYQMIDPLYFDTTFGLTNCGDVLKKLALDWCAFTGMVSYDKAFFKKLFHYDSSNTQTLNVLHREKGFRYGLLDYVKVTTNISSPNEPYEEGTFTGIEGRFLTRKSLPGFFSDAAGPSWGSNIKAVVSRSGYFVFVHNGGASYISPYPAEGDTYSNNGSVFEVIGTPVNESISRLTAKRISGTNDPSASGTLTMLTGSAGDITYTSVGDADGTYQIYQSKDDNLLSGAFSDHGALLANFWYNFRGNINNCRVDRFILAGVDYDFTKDFVYDGSKYQLISLVPYLSQAYSEAEAIYIGEV